MSWPVIHRLVYEQRVRLLLELLFTAAWGFLLVALFATSDTFNQMLQQQAHALLVDQAVDHRPAHACSSP